MSPSEPVGTIRAVDLGEGGVVGDRAYAIVDRETGKVASAKHSKLWPNLLKCRASFVEPPRPGDEVPPARIDLAGVYAVAEAAGTIRQDDQVSLV